MDSDARARPPVRRRVLESVLFLLGSIVLAATTRADAPVDPATVDVGHPTGHVHDHDTQTWPPQPRGMQNAVPLNNPDEQRVLAEAQKRRADSKGRIAISRADVRKALGARYTPAAVVEDRGESGTIEASRLVYFSYSKNSTVEVTFEGQRVRGVKTTPAAEYQPEITGEEIVKAEGIARAHFAALGQNRVADLQAFGILAYKPNGKGFYATRVLYVSFHPDSDSPPEYLAWVDLSTQRVLRARLEAP